MTNSESMALPVPAFAGGTKAITKTPVVGTPRREYTEMFIPGEEELEEGEMRVTVLGSGNPWNTRAQASASVMVEVGNPERDILVFDIGSGSLANYASLKLPVNKLNKVFLSHLHADHTGDLITVSGSWSKVGRADGPIYVWGPSGTEPRLGTRHFVEAIEEALAWDTAAGNGAINPESMKIVASEFDFSQTQVVYEANGVKVTSFPVVHALSGAVGYRLDFAGLSFAFSGDARACWPLVRACEGVDLLIHEWLPTCSSSRRRVGTLHRVGDDRPQFRPHIAQGCRQGIRAGEAACGGSLPYVALTPGHPDGLRGAWQRVQWPRGPDPGPDGVQHHEGGRGRSPGKAIRPVASNTGQAANGVRARRGAASRLVGNGAHPTRRRPVTCLRRGMRQSRDGRHREQEPERGRRPQYGTWTDVVSGLRIRRQ